MPDESTMWGAHYNSLNSLAACPNSTTDFAMLAQFVSTPFTCKTPHSSNFFQDEGTTGDHTHVRVQTRVCSSFLTTLLCFLSVQRTVVAVVVMTMNL